MQFAKDSFYVALSQRLSQLNPARTVSINGVTRAAIMVAENELITAALPIQDAFFVIWGAAQICDEFGGAPEPLVGIECTIWYGTSGATEDASDRGRCMTELDSELLRICSPPFTDKRDYTKAESTPLNSNVFWTTPEIAPVYPNSEAHDTRAMMKQNGPVFHVAKLRVFFYPEVA